MEKYSLPEVLKSIPIFFLIFVSSQCTFISGGGDDDDDYDDRVVNLGQVNANFFQKNILFFNYFTNVSKTFRHFSDKKNQEF